MHVMCVITLDLINEGRCMDDHLFVFYIGGDTPTSRIELHDIAFGIGTTYEDCIDDLHDQWWGTPESLHIDCYGILNHADGYDIGLSKQPVENNGHKLWFVNLGGYDPAQFTELHKNIFVVAPDQSKAKVKALKQILDWSHHHRDNQYDVEKIFCLDDILKSKNLHLTLTQNDHGQVFEFTCGYFPIGRSKAA